jgi:hypothetical protein
MTAFDGRVLHRELYIARICQRLGLDSADLETCDRDGPLGPLRFAAEELRVASNIHHGYLSSHSAALAVEAQRDYDGDAPGDALAPLAAYVDEWAAAVRTARRRLERTVEAMLAGNLTGS